MKEWISDIINLGSLGFLATIFFKYFEKKRKEKEYLNKRKEAATLIYCELIYNFSKMMKRSLNERLDLLVIEDWKNKISTLHEILDISEMKSLYDLYNFFIFYNKNKSFNNIANNSEYDKIINKIFIKEFLQYKFLNFGEDPIGFLSDKYFQILGKLENVVDRKSGHCKRKNIKIDWNKTIKEYYLENGDLLYSFTYKGNKKIKGILNFYKYNKLVSLFDCSFNENEAQESGYIKQYDNFSEKLEYDGFILNNLYHGKGILSLSEGYKFEGEFKKGIKIYGKERTSKYSFEGEFKEDEPFTGKLESKEINYKCDGIYNFNGELRNGKAFLGEGYFKIGEDNIEGPPPEYNHSDTDEYKKQEEENKQKKYLSDRMDELAKQKPIIIELLKCTINNKKIIKSENNIFNKEYV